MNRIIAPLIVSLCLLLAPSVLAAKEAWTSVKSHNFTVVGNAPENELRSITMRLEQFRRAYSVIFAADKVDSPVPTIVVVFKNDESFAPFKPLYKGKARENLVGYFQRGTEVNYIALTTDPRLKDPLDVIFHEYGHFIIENNIHNVPVWLNEGLAEFYSTFDSSGDETKVKLGAPILRHIAALRNQSFIPLDKLINVDARSPMYNEGDKAGIFYAESWALVHYLMLGDHQKHATQFTRFLSALNPNETQENTFKRIFETDFKTMDKELYQYINGLTLPAIEYTLSKKLNYDHNTISETLSEARFQYYLGDLLLKTRRLKEAEVRLEGSVAADSNFAAAKGSLGMLRLEQGRLADALSLLKTATEIAPENYLIRYYYGNALNQNREYKSAIEQYKQAAALKPNFAVNYVNLGFLYAAEGNIEEAESAFKLAIKYEPSFPLYRATSADYFVRGRWDLAAEHGMRFLGQSGWHNDHSPYAALIAYFGFSRAKRTDEANSVLNKGLTIFNATAWPYPVVKYLSGTLSEKELFALAKDNDKLTEAHTYVGLNLLLHDENENALTHLRWVIENGNRGFFEYRLSVAEINRILQASKP